MGQSSDLQDANTKMQLAVEEAKNEFESKSAGMSEEELVKRIDALHEVAQMLRPGAKARLVIPSYLAYGVAGDGDKIQGLQPIVMEIRVLEKDEKLPENYNLKPNNAIK